MALLSSVVAAMVLAVWQGTRPADGATVAEQKAFIAAMLPGAQQSWDEYQVPVSVTLSQAILESGWGTSALSTDHHAYFGIKCVPGGYVSPHQAGCVPMETKEYLNGAWVVKVAYFRSYASATDSLADHGHYLRNRGIYDAAFNHTDDPYRFAQEIQRAGYATDPNYADLLLRVMTSQNLFQYDAAPATVTATPSSPASSSAPVVTPTPSPSVIVTPSATVTSSQVVTPTPTPSASASTVATPTATASTPTSSASSTPTRIVTPTATASASTVAPSASPSVTVSAAPSVAAPTTVKPSSIAPSSIAPSTVKPSSVVPSTVKPSTPAPTASASAPLPSQKPQDPQIVKPALVEELTGPLPASASPSTSSEPSSSSEPSASSKGSEDEPTPSTRPLALPSTGD